VKLRCRCAAFLPVQAGDAALWQPRDWCDVLQPVADLVRVTTALYRSDEPARMQHCRDLLDTLAEAPQAFEPGQIKSPGCKKFVHTVQDLLRCVQRPPSLPTHFLRALCAAASVHQHVWEGRFPSTKLHIADEPSLDSGGRSKF
jgi:hypothetical protein